MGIAGLGGGTSIFMVVLDGPAAPDVPDGPAEPAGLGFSAASAI